MDKKKKIKMVSTVCFVLICGVVCVYMHYGRQRKEQIVLEQNENVQEYAEDAVTGEKETDDAKYVSEAGEIKPDETGSSTGVSEEKSRVPGELPEAAQDAVIYVHICGAVTAEGVYTLPKGSRLTDGVTAAGGFLPEADTAYHNLAAVMSDGQKVYVPTKEETKEVPVSERTEPVDGGGTEKTEPDTVNVVQQNKININNADVSELTTLSGIGEAKAKSILQYREKVGAFQSIEELKNVSGIGDAMFERVKEYITVE